MPLDRLNSGSGCFREAVRMLRGQGCLQRWMVEIEYCPCKRDKDSQSGEQYEERPPPSCPSKWDAHVREPLTLPSRPFHVDRESKLVMRSRSPAHHLARIQRVSKSRGSTRQRWKRSCRTTARGSRQLRLWKDRRRSANSGPRSPLSLGRNRCFGVATGIARSPFQRNHRSPGTTQA